MTAAIEERTRRGLVFVTIAVLLAAMMLRSPIVAVAPIARAVADDLGVGAGVVGLFTSIPVLLFGLCSPLAVWVQRRVGADAALTICLGGAVLACLLRSSGGLATALVGTALLGAFITIGNVVVPAIISREYSPERAHVMTGVYTSAINVGTMTVTLATAPLELAIGWRGALAFWAVFGAVALAIWIPTRGRAAIRPLPHVMAPALAEAPSVLRSSRTCCSRWLSAASRSAITA